MTVVTSGSTDLAIHQLVIVPLCVVRHVLLHQVCVALDVGHLQVEVGVQLLQVLQLGRQVVVHRRLEVLAPLLDGQSQPTVDLVNVGVHLCEYSTLLIFLLLMVFL